MNTRCGLDLSHNCGNSDSLLVDSLGLSGGSLSLQKSHVHAIEHVGKETDLSHFA